MSATLSCFEPRYARRAERMKTSEIRELLKLLDRPDIISFAGGIPDPALFPAEAAAEAYREALTLSPSLALQYSVSEGYLPLREWIAGRMRSLGAPAEPDNIVITSGSQQALDFLGKLLISPGDTALVTSPVYLGALQAFSPYEPRFDAIDPECGNRAPETYREAAASSGVGARVTLAYAVPDFDNPTGKTLSTAARQNLLGLAQDLDVPLIEDSAYRALRFEGSSPPTLQALDVERVGSLDASRVIHLGTFSKTIAPGLRVGWVCASRAIVRRLVLVKQASDLDAPLVNQMVMAKLAGSQLYRLVGRACAHYRVKRDAMLAALDAFMPSGVRWTRPEGGLFVWLTLPERTNGAALLARAVEEAGVSFVPGGAFFAEGGGENTLRLSYSLPSVEDISEGIRRLATLL
jgi:DNA-binding transcriptional MocR family regulator